VSHDLRTPLRHILAFADLLKQQSGEQLDKDGRHLLGRISGSAQRMSELIEGLLRFSRTNRSELQKVPVDLNRLIEDVVRELEIDTQNRAISLKIAKMPEVSADPLLLRQVLLNVIGNAIKYSRPRPQPRIEIGQTSADREIIIFVRDNGVGFDMKYIDRLFGVFQRLHRESEFEGTGIGLATARKIISRHGGRIWAEAQLDQGATFYIALPGS
ncbi:MAG TPA: ATP-binding protein, partial [Opitutaceae bacterium]